jgi:hypothetical protein
MSYPSVIGTEGRGELLSLQRRASALSQLNAPVLVTVVAMRMMQVPVHQIVDMVAVGDRLMPAGGTVLVGALYVRRAARRIGRVDADDMLIDVVAMHVVHMAVVQVVDVPVMADGSMAAAGAVLMGMVRMVLLIASGHGVLLLC